MRPARAPCVDGVGSEREARHDADVEEEVRHGAEGGALKAFSGDGGADVAQVERGGGGQIERAVLCMFVRRVPKRVRRRSGGASRFERGLVAPWDGGWPQRQAALSRRARAEGGRERGRQGAGRAHWPVQLLERTPSTHLEQSDAAPGPAGSQLGEQPGDTAVCTTKLHQIHTDLLAHEFALLQSHC